MKTTPFSSMLFSDFKKIRPCLQTEIFMWINRMIYVWVYVIATCTSYNPTVDKFIFDVIRKNVSFDDQCILEKLFSHVCDQFYG